MASPNRSLSRPRPSSQASGARLVQRVGRVRELGLLVALLVILAVVGLQERRFLGWGNLREILLSVAIVTIVAVGETLVILTRNVDLSVGSMVGLTAYVAADLLKRDPGLGIPTVVLLAALLGAGLGALNGLLVTVGRVPAIVATLGALYIYRGIDFWIAGGKQVTAYEIPDAYFQLAGARVLGIPVLVITAAVITFVVGYALRYTRSGRQLYAIGSNPEAARLAGIRRDSLVFTTFVLCGLLSGIAGVLWGSRYATVDARAAQGLELEVVAAVVVGGVNIFGGSGTIFGAALGAILLGTIGNALTILRLNQYWLQAINGGAILAAVTVDALITRRLQRALLARRNR
jgi:rhamnose transport system permease protein